jgi:hypothetical protein
VKFLRMTGRQNSLATAIGQAALYLGRYEHVSLVLIDLNPSTPESRQQFEYQARQIGLEAVIRPRLGDRLSTQSPSS